MACCGLLWRLFLVVLTVVVVLVSLPMDTPGPEVVWGFTPLSPPPGLQATRIPVQKGMQVTVWHSDISNCDKGTIMFLHGFPDTPLSLKHQLNHFADRGYFVIAPFMRGYEAASLNETSYHVIDIASDLKAILDYFDRQVKTMGQIKANSVRPVHVVGHDWGAVIGSTASHLYSHDIASFTGIAIPAQMDADLFLEVPKQIYYSWYMLFFQLRFLSDFVVSFKDLAFIDKLWKDWSPSFQDENRFPIDSVLAVKTQFKDPRVLQGAMSYYRHLLPGFLLGAAPPLQRLLKDNYFVKKAMELGKMSKMPSIVPTQCIHGLDDGCLAKESFFARDPKALFTHGFRLTSVPKAGHWVMLEQPDMVNSLIHEWVQHHGSASSSK